MPNTNSARLFFHTKPASTREFPTVAQARTELARLIVADPRFDAFVTLEGLGRNGWVRLSPDTGQPYGTELAPDMHREWELEGALHRTEQRGDRHLSGGTSR